MVQSASAPSKPSTVDMAIAEVVDLRDGQQRSRAECATERGQYRDLVQLVCVSVVAARAAAERGPAPPGRAERGGSAGGESESDGASAVLSGCRPDKQDGLTRGGRGGLGSHPTFNGGEGSGKRGNCSDEMSRWRPEDHHDRR